MNAGKVGFKGHGRTHGRDIENGASRGGREQRSDKVQGSSHGKSRDFGNSRGNDHGSSHSNSKDSNRDGGFNRASKFAAMNAREASYKVLMDFHTGRGDLEKIIDTLFEKGNINPKDKRLAFEISYGVLRNKRYLDYAIDQYLDQKLMAEIELRIAIQIALYQILFLDKIPVHAAVNESVELMKISKDTRKFSGAVNGILRKLIDNKKEITKIPETMDKNERLSIEFSHPEWLIERWTEQYGSGKAKKLLKWNNSKPTNFIRWNSMAVPQKAFESDIASLTETSPQGTGFEKRYYRINDHIMPAEISAFKAGACTVQSPSSGWPVAMLGCKPGDIVLDVASAPGGKTTLIAELIGKDGLVVACDTNPKRMTMVQENAIRLKVADRIIPILMDGAHVAITKFFDSVLLDAPCSGTGVIQRHPDSRWIRKPQDINNVVKIQAAMLESASVLVKKGGVLVYSTCSLEREENQSQVENFLKNHPEFELQDARDFADRKFVDVNGYLVITPHDHNLDGMFAARMVRTRTPYEGNS